MRRKIAILMSWVIFAASVGAPCNVYASDADTLLTLSESTARTLAQATFFQFLMQSVLKASPWAEVLKNIHQSDVGWIKAMNPSEDISQIVRSSLNNAMTDYTRAADLVKANDLRADELYNDLNSYIENYDNAVIQARALLDRVDNDREIATMADQMITHILTDVQKMCDGGIAISFSSPNLMPLTPKWPGQMGFQASFNLNDGSGGSPADAQAQGDQKDNSYGLELFPIVSELGGQNAGAYNAALTYGTLAGSYYILGGGFTLATASLTVGLMAGGITAIIAVILLLVTDAIDRNKSRQQADDVQRVFYNRANAMTVAADVKAYCQSKRADLEAVPSIVDAIRRGGPDSPQANQFKARHEAAQKVARQLIALAQAAQKKQADLASSMKGGDVQKAMSESDEFKNYNSFIASLGDGGLMEVLLVELIDIQLAAGQSAQELDVFREQTLAGTKGILKFLEAHEQLFEERRDRLFAWNRLANLARQEKDLPEILVANQQGLVDSAEVAKSWQKDYFQTVNDYLNKNAMTADVTTLSNDLRRVDDLQKKYGENSVLDLIARRTQALLDLVGAHS